MKKFLKLMPLILIIFAVLSLPACVGDGGGPSVDGIENGGLLYEISDDGLSCSVIGVKTPAEEYTVVGEINGVPVTSIGNSAFYNADFLRRISLPDTLTEIQAYAFDNCYSLESISLPDGVVSIGFNAFSDCGALKEIRFPKSLKAVDTGAFVRCESLEKVYINSALETVSKNAFKDCDAISEVHVADLASWCRVKLENVDSNPLTIADKLFVGGIEVSDITVEGVERISNYAFFGFSGIKSLVLGDGVITVGASAFSNCENLSRLTLSDSVEVLEISAFNSCTSLEYVYVGSGAGNFGGLAFYGCHSLRRVEIKDLKAWCGVYFYTDNSGSSNPLRYANELVVDGEVVTDLYIPDGTQKISKLAFINFKGTSVSLPKSLKTIEDTAFYLSPKISKIYYRGTATDFSLLSVGANNFLEVELIYVK